MLRNMNKSFLLSGNDVEIITDFQTMSDGLEVYKRRRAGSGPDVSAQSSLRRYAYADSQWDGRPFIDKAKESVARVFSPVL